MDRDHSGLPHGGSVLRSGITGMGEQFENTVEFVYLIKTDELMAKVKKIWTGELNKKEADLKEINLYLKPEDNAAYYVINGSCSGRIDF